MPARRCAIGCESWPDDEDFKECLECGEPTRRIRNIRPTLTDEEAASRLKHALFEQYLADNGIE